MFSTERTFLLSRSLIWVHVMVFLHTHNFTTLPYPGRHKKNWVLNSTFPHNNHTHNMFIIVYGYVSTNRHTLSFTYYWRLLVIFYPSLTITIEGKSYESCLSQSIIDCFNDSSWELFNGKSNKTIWCITNTPSLLILPYEESISSESVVFINSLGILRIELGVLSSDFNPQYPVFTFLVMTVMQVNLFQTYDKYSSKKHWKEVRYDR